MEVLPVPRRLEVDELLDEHDAPREDVEHSLRDLRWLNRFMGGKRAWRRLTLLTTGTATPSSILELGTGTSDLLESVPEITLRIGLDIKIDHLLYGRDIGDRSIRRVLGDAKRLPFRDGSIDLSGSSHFFHHFSLEDNALILDECLRVCRRGVFVTDTRRHYLPLLFVKLLAALHLVGRITRFDAPASVIQSYTPGEVQAFSKRFTELSKKVARMIPFRFALILWKNDG